MDLTLEDFIVYCEKGVCLRKSIISLACEKSYKRQKCYDKWILKQEQKQNKSIEIDIDWEEIKRKVWVRDRGECQLSKKLISETRDILKINAKQLFKELDCCHYKGRGSHCNLKYVLDNVVLLNRFSHNMLDQKLSPITGKVITKEEWQYWWEFILVKELKEKLDNI